MIRTTIVAQIGRVRKMHVATVSGSSATEAMEFFDDGGGFPPCKPSHRHC